MNALKATGVNKIILDLNDYLIQFKDNKGVFKCFRLQNIYRIYLY